jgi:uridylate kinase
MQELKYKRVLLKLSGEALMGEKPLGIDISVVKRISKDIKEVYDTGVQLCIVVGGGNIYRGVQASAEGMERAAADYMGMLATVMNSLCLQNNLEQEGIYTRVLSAIPMTSICEPYIRRKAARHMEKGRVVIFAAGTGNPFFTTDSAAVLRAIEMNCDILLKGTQVDGVYDKDPKIYNDAKKFKNISYTEVLKDNLNVMDMAAIALARENKIPIKIFSIGEPGNVARVLRSEGSYTKIEN